MLLNAARHATKRIGEAVNACAPSLRRGHEHELLQIDLLPRILHASAANFTGDNSRVDIVARRAPRLFFVIAQKEVEVCGGYLLNFARQTPEESRETAKR